MEWTAEAILARLEAEPGLRFEDLIRERAVQLNRSYQSAARDFNLVAGDPRYKERFLALTDEKEDDLTYGFPEPNASDPKALWLNTFLRTRHQNKACAIAGVKITEVQSWYTSGNEDYDPEFAESFREAYARVVAALEDDIQTARRFAIATGDGKALAMISTRALESLSSAKWGRSRLEISGTLRHVGQLSGATHAQLAERADRLLSGSPVPAEGEAEVIEGECEELPS